jgi:BarA-like signal transduction histidine kinase
VFDCGRQFIPELLGYARQVAEHLKKTIKIDCLCKPVARKTFIFKAYNYLLISCLTLTHPEYGRVGANTTFLMV